MTWGKSVLLTIPLVLSGIFVVASPASAVTRIGSWTDWTSVSAGAAHACGIRAGKLYCWGSNDSGQVGNGGDDRQDAPDDIGSNNDWTAVSAGAAHTCGIRASKLYCWGSDTDGQIGNGAGTSTTRPVQIGTLTNWTSVSAGAAHTCGIRSTAYLYCWGSDASGQLGNGTYGPRTSPGRITTASDWKSVSAGGSHTCGVRGKGALTCWGSDASGQVGDGGGPGGDAISPKRIGTLLDWRSVTSGGAHTCAIRASGYLNCWGSDSGGQIGNGSTGAPSAPTRITGSSDWKIVSAGVSNSCATRGTGALYCWGDNTYGQVYDGSSTKQYAAPLRLFSSAADYRRTDAGGRLSCGSRGAGVLYCWGGKQPPSSCTNVTYQRPDSIDLNRWKLTIPFDGADSGGYADEIKQPELADYHTTNQDYFEATTSGSGRIFTAATTGATTKSSNYPRSELREMTVWNGSSYTEAAWSNKSGVHVLTFRGAIKEVPTRNDGRDPVVAAQIHGGSDVGDILQVRLERQNLFVTVPDGGYIRTLTSSYALGTPFDLQLQADACGITVTYNGSRKTTIPVVAENATWYFKAGVYTQANPTNGSGYGQVQIDGLSITHGS